MRRLPHPSLRSLPTLALVLSACTGEPEPEGPRLFLDVAGEGDVFSRPTGIECGKVGATCSSVFRQGDVVRLAAVPSSGWVFRGFSGDCQGEERLTELRLGLDDATCDATFVQWAPGDPIVTPRELTLTVDGPGTVEVSPLDDECRTDATCRFVAEDHAGLLLSVSHRPEAFLGWEGDCSGSGLTHPVLLDEDKACSARFDDAVYYPVRIEVTGEGRVESAPAGIACREGGEDCEHSFREGTYVVLSAVPDSGHSFAEWGHQCIDPYGNPFTSTVLELTAGFGLACSAAFEPGGTGPGPGPSGWTCSQAFYDDGFLCDCGCGAPDPDCASSSPSACDYCDSGCSQSSCPGTITTPNHLCGGGGPPGSWICDFAWFGTNDGCDCGCGVVDPDCTSSSSGACDFCSQCGICSSVDPFDNSQCL